MDDYKEQIRHKSAFCNLRYIEKRNIIIVTWVNAARQGLGHGTGLMTLVCQTADQRKADLGLQPRRFGPTGLNTFELVKFYEKFGFVMQDKGFMIRKFREKEA